MRPGRAPGTYALLLELPHERRIRIGALGPVELQAGCFVYVGSALGPGGLGARVGRHAAGPKTLHWHVDHLRVHTRLLEVWFTEDPVRREHLWASVLVGLSGGIPAPRGFGASDCSCSSHLARFSSPPRHDLFHRRLLRVDPDHGPVRRASAEELAP